MSMFDSKYQAIRIYSQHIGSYEYFIEDQQAQAEASGAPLTAIYKREGANTWTTIADIENKNISRSILTKLLEYYAYHETPEKHEAWRKARAPLVICGRTI